jgi:hypothetical protein
METRQEARGHRERLRPVSSFGVQCAEETGVTKDKRENFIGYVSSVKYNTSIWNLIYTSLECVSVFFLFFFGFFFSWLPSVIRLFGIMCRPSLSFWLSRPRLVKRRGGQGHRIARPIAGTTIKRQPASLSLAMARQMQFPSCSFPCFLGASRNLLVTPTKAGLVTKSS